MLNRIAHIVVAFIGLTCTVCAQDLAGQFQDFTNKINQATTVYFKSTIGVDYTDNQSSSQDIVYERTPDRLYYKLVNMEMIANRELSLMIYPDNKTVLWQKSITDKGESDPIGKSISLSDTLLNKNDSIVYKGIVGASHNYIVYSSKKYIMQSEFSFRVSDGMLTQAIYIYNPKYELGITKTTLRFTSISVNLPAKNDIAINSILKIENKKYTLMPAYAGFQLICLDTKY